MIDEDEVQRKELRRLLTSAKDESKRVMLRRALSNLDSNGEKASLEKQDSFSASMSPTLQASLFSANQTLTAVETFTNMQKRRPPSACRRPSVSNLLDIIPETITKTLEKIDEFILPLEDVAEVISSSYDCRFPPKGIFSHTNGHSSPNSSISHGFRGYNDSRDRPSWISTGLTPQFITVVFFEKWVVRKVEIHCNGVARIGTQINTSATSSAISNLKLLQMKQTEDNTFTLDLLDSDIELIYSGIPASGAGGRSGSFSYNNSGRDSTTNFITSEGVPGIGITIVILKTTSMFCSISDVKIKVTPQV